MNSPQSQTVLVIEDDESVRRTLQDMLELNGFAVLTANNGREGLDLARGQTPSLILTDIEMPGMTGFELLQRLRAEPDLRALPVIVLSAKADRMAMRHGMELGAADFITKPFTEDEVIHSIAARLKKRGVDGRARCLCPHGRPRFEKPAGDSPGSAGPGTAYLGGSR